MKEYTQRLFLIEGAEVFLNSEKINEDHIQKRVNVEIYDDFIRSEDNAAGIPF